VTTRGTKVLVTGASGFIGSRCLLALVESGAEVHAVGRGAGTDTEGVTWHRADLLDAADRRTIIDRVAPTHLLHAAWYAKPGRFWDSGSNVRWLSASLDLAEQFGRVGGRRALGVGTCAEYDSAGGVCREDATPCLPVSLYGRAKLAAGQGFMASGEAFGYAAAWARVFAPYGPGEPEEKLIPYAIRTWLAGEVVRCGDLQRVRDFIYIEDVAQGLVKLLLHEAGGVFNVSTGVPVTLSEVLGRVDRALGGGGRMEVEAREVRADDPLILVGDPSRLAALGDWRPRVDIAGGIERTVKYWRSVNATDNSRPRTKQSL
jgi:nucleoside-diphosphate-sugar epimerase